MESTPTLLTIDALQTKATDIRCDVIRMITEAKAGHPGGSLSIAEIITALYFRVMCIDPNQPEWALRDRFILSKGHACPVWYAALAERGYFNKTHLGTLRRIDSILQGHPDMRKTPGVDMTTGSLGQGLSVGIGMALSAKLRSECFHVWVVLGDGEMQEGSIWEAAMAGAMWSLDNLTAIIDCNGLQSDGPVSRQMPIASVAPKWRAFGWRVNEINGHNMQEVVDALEQARDTKGLPTVIIAHTVKGKGVSFMENVIEWHSKTISIEQANVALAEIRSCVS